MGQKTHPTGFRLGINKPWTSVWFANHKKFPKFLSMDFTLRRYIAKRLPNAGISKVEINRTEKKITVTLHTSRPGIVIGKGGEEVDRLKEEIKSLSGGEVKVNVSESVPPLPSSTVTVMSAGPF